MKDENRIKPMPGGRLLYLPEGADTDECRKKYPLKDEAISGLTKEEHFCLFQIHKADVDTLKALIDLWLDKL